MRENGENEEGERLRERGMRLGPSSSSLSSLVGAAVMKP